MSGENRQNDIDADRTAPVSPGSPESCCEEKQRQSQSPLSENAPEDGKTEGDGGVAGDDVPPHKVRRTREEIESMYRNDPRLSMLFGHEPEQKEAAPVWSIKVGGLRLTLNRLLILAGFFLVILICLGAGLFYAIRDYHKQKDFMQAQALFESGDYENARNMLIKVLSDDPNKEEALAALAKIYQKDGDWNNEAFLRQRIMRLNLLDQENLHEFLESAFKARNFGSIYSILHLKLMENPDLPPEEGALYLISALNSSRVSNGRYFYESRKKTDPEYFSSTERGRLAEMMLNAPSMENEQWQNCIASVDQIRDPQTRFETINLLLPFLAERGDRESTERIEKFLHEAVELNSFAGAPMLAKYYYSTYRFDEVIRICEEYLKTRINAVMPILYGESCILSGQPDLIPPMEEKIRNLSDGRQSWIIASYLAALYAFQEGDDARLQVLLQRAGDTIDTPLSTLMKYHLALEKDSRKEILSFLRKIMYGRHFFDFPERARTAALQYLLKKTNEADFDADPELLTVCAEIATLIQTPDDDVSFLQRIILTDHFNRDILTEDELQSALRSFPGDPVLLGIAAEFCLRNGKPVQAMEYISEYKKMKDIPEKTKSSVDVLYMLALEQLGRKEEAEKEFRALVERGDEFLLPFYFDFCTKYGFVDSLRSLCQWIESLPEDSPNRAALPFVRAELLLSEGKKQEALDLFEKSASVYPDYTFHAATRLAENGRTAPALTRYLSLRDVYSDKSLLEIRLAELYAQMGDKDAALASAREAWLMDKNSLTTRFLYGKYLFDAGKYADAVGVLKLPQYKADFPKEMLDLWASAIREQIKADYKTGRYTPAMESVKHLLLYFPEDKVGQEYLERIEKIRRHENVGGRQI